MSLPKNILAIYDSQDKDVLQHLLAHLRPLEKDFHITILSDDAIHRGQTWKHQSISLLDHADVFLLLLSNTFMHSEFIKQDEFKMVIDSYKEGKATVIPILLDNCPWDVEFTFTDYTFNFKELLVFRQDEMQIGNWGPKDQVYTQVAYYVRGLLTSSTKKRTLLEPVTTGVKAIPETRKEEQIAIDFLEEREANHKVEWERKDKKEAVTKKRVEEDNQLRDEAEAKEIIRKAKRLRQKAEIQKRILKEKTLKEKAKKDRTIEEDVETKRGVQEEIWGNELTRTNPIVEEKKDGETTLPQRETKREKGLGVIVAAPKKTTKKNSLARYNYQFKTAKTVEAKRVLQEKCLNNEEAKSKIAVANKRSGEILESLRETEREKNLEQIVAAAKKNSLARYNYEFKTAKTVEAKRVVIEEWRGEGEPKAKTAEANKRRSKSAKFQRALEREKRLAKIITALKINQSSLQNYQVKSTKAINQFFQEAKAKLAVDEIRYRKIVAVLKRNLKKNRFVVQNYQVKSAKAINQFFKETKTKVAVDEIRFWEVVAVLKRGLKRNNFVIQNYQVKIATAINQFLKDAKEKINSNKKRRVRSELVIACLVVFGILIYVFTGDSEKQSNKLLEIEQAEVNSDAVVNTETNTENQAAAILKLGIGDMYKGGIIFAIDSSNKTGKIAYMDDEGPMTWNNAMTIHEQIGEGWRLPTLDELRLMYKNIGQGADNRGEFADKLYWSATPFDDYQARLLRFSDGNASYHFNSVGTYRKFRVRAIQNFK